jgi:hypothetical protein
MLISSKINIIINQNSRSFGYMHVLQRPFSQAFGVSLPAHHPQSSSSPPYCSSPFLSLLNIAGRRRLDISPLVAPGAVSNIYRIPSAPSTASTHFPLSCTKPRATAWRGDHGSADVAAPAPQWTRRLLTAGCDGDDLLLLIFLYSYVSANPLVMHRPSTLFLLV